MNTPRVVDPTWLDRTMYPFPDSEVAVDGHTIHYLDTGSPEGTTAGPTLLLLHGNPTWSFVYREVIARLSGSVRCVAPDLPGFGLSTPAADFAGAYVEHADAIEGFVRALGLHEVVLVMQDWGGPIGLRLLEREPERFGGVVLCNTWAWPVADDPHFARFAGFMGGRFGSFLTRQVNLFVNMMIPMGHKRRRLTRAEITHYRRALATASRRQFSAVMPREILDATPALAALEEGLGILRTKPVLIVWGDRDMAFRDRELERWRGIVPDASVHIVAGAGHFVQSDAPDEVAARIGDWLGVSHGAATVPPGVETA